jgi:hypothetical protein
MNTKEQTNPTELQATIKLGIDAHAKWFYMARQVDGATPQPVQKMTLDRLLCFVARQQRLAREVYTCYEAGLSATISTESWQRWVLPTTSCSPRTGTNAARG